MKVAVTGATGRIGRDLVERARALGYDVVAIDRRGPDPADGSTPGTRPLTLDVTDYDALRAALEGCDALVHLAAITGPGHHPDHVVHDENVVGSYHALRAAVDVGIRRICQASSVNAIGGRFSRVARYDYLPVDERHPTYAEDPYSLSKWFCEQQADSIARRFDDVTISSLRLHGIVEDRAAATHWTEAMPEAVVRQLWGYTTRDAAVRACLAAITAEFRGHETMYIVAPDTMSDVSSLELHARHYPSVPVVGDLSGNRSFFDGRKAMALLDWTPEPSWAG
jgi:nucleoside-diphosphate-sugar epimerase